MSLFDVMSRGNHLKVNKVSEANTTVMEGYVYEKTITNSTKANALKAAKKQQESGIIKIGKVKERYLKKKNDSLIKKQPVINKKIEPLPTLETNELKCVIYSDFNGVLDDRELDSTIPHETYGTFRLPKVTCPHKIFKLTKLMVETNSELVMTSMWRTMGAHFYNIIKRCLKASNIPEYSEYFDENKESIYELTDTYPTSDTGVRTDEIRKHILENRYTNFVVFEDEHPIDQELNPIMTDWSVGLLDEHIEKARLVLNEK